MRITKATRNGLRERKKKSVKDRLTSNMKRLRNDMNDMAAESGISDDECYKMLILYHTIAIHQHLEQLVYERDT